MATIYKSTDVGAPVMNSSAGSLLDVLKACLVDGYGSKSAAGWGYTAVDAATKQGLFTQGAKEGRVRRHLYLNDNSATPATASGWACSTCSVSASPVFTENFWAGGSTYLGAIVKADQERGSVAAWVVVADDRSMILLTKRSNWGERGWAFTFVGDIETGFSLDKGCFSVAGWNTNDAALSTLAFGVMPRSYTRGSTTVFGHTDGTFSLTTYTLNPAIGYYAGVASGLQPRSKYARETQLGRVVAADTDRFRGHIPFIWVPIAATANFSYYLIADASEVKDPSGMRTFLHYQFDPTSNTRIFVEV